MDQKSAWFYCMLLNHHRE